MTYRSEFREWLDEIEAPKLSIGQRVAKWFDRPGREPEPAPEYDADMFAWRSVADWFGARP